MDFPQILLVDKAFIFPFSESYVSLSIQAASPKTVKKWEGSEILPYLQANKLANTVSQMLV